MYKYLTLLSILSTLTFSCSDTDENNEISADASVGSPMLSYSNLALPDLGADFVYEGWLIVDGDAKAAGRFSVDDMGVASPASFTLDAEVASMASLFVLTIEPKVGDAPTPSSTHIIAGAISNGTASLVTDHMAALSTDFASATGSYILATPTTGDDSMAEQGIWFLKPGETPGASLVLPELPEGWAYEGWIVDSNGPVSTGRFTNVAMADSDGAGAFKGAVGNGPPFPGQDFITPATVLNGGAVTAVISVEPEPDNSAGPFLIKPLIHKPIGSATAPAEHMMMNNASGTLPSAMITISGL